MSTYFRPALHASPTPYSSHPILNTHPVRPLRHGGSAQQRHLHRSLAPGNAVVILALGAGNGLVLVQHGQEAENDGDSRLQLDLVEREREVVK